VQDYDPEKVLAYLEGDMAEADREAFEAQLAENDQLQQLVDRLSADRAALRQLADQSPPRDLADEAVGRLEREALLGEPAGQTPPAKRPGPRRWAGPVMGGVAAAAVVTLASWVILRSLVGPSVVNGGGQLPMGPDAEGLASRSNDAAQTAAPPTQPANQPQLAARSSAEQSASPARQAGSDAAADTRTSDAEGQTTPGDDRTLASAKKGSADQPDSAGVGAEAGAKPAAGDQSTKADQGQTPQLALQELNFQSELTPEADQGQADDAAESSPQPMARANQGAALTPREPAATTRPTARMAKRRDFAADQPAAPRGGPASPAESTQPESGPIETPATPEQSFDVTATREAVEKALSEWAEAEAALWMDVPAEPTPAPAADDTEPADSLMAEVRQRLASVQDAADPERASTTTQPDMAEPSKEPGRWLITLPADLQPPLKQRLELLSHQPIQVQASAATGDVPAFQGAGPLPSPAAKALAQNWVLIAIKATPPESTPSPATQPSRPTPATAPASQPALPAEPGL
jgi:hypothetical protein